MVAASRQQHGIWMKSVAAMQMAHVSSAIPAQVSSTIPVRHAVPHGGATACFGRTGTDTLGGSPDI